MHMPGHKRKGLKNSLPYNIDVTEIDGFDNLHHASGILKESMEEASKLFGSKQTYYSVNGSSGGILASIRALTRFGDKVIVARNSHKSVYNAIELMGLRPIYILPSIDEESGIFNSINPLQVESLIKENLDTSLVVITSPSYEGIISDIKSISEICHKYNIPLMVDEAHGSHLYLEDKSALQQGGDIVVNSLHKTLPSLTQTAVVNIKGKIVDSDKVERELSVFETSSPSYILLSSIDSCIRFMKEKGEYFYKNYNENLKIFSEKLKLLRNLKVICHGNNKLENHEGFYDFDYGKIVISTSNVDLTGTELMNILRNKYKIECEMAYTNYCLAMTTLFDDKKSLNRLANALLQIDKTLTFFKKKLKYDYQLPSLKFSPLEIRDKKKAQVDLEDSLSKISCEYVWVYPPGIPILVPGEVINKEVINQVKKLNESGLEINSTFKDLPNKITIFK